MEDSTSISLILLISLKLLASQNLPKIQPFYFPKQVILGQKVSTICTAIAGDPPLEFSWLKDSREIQSKDELSIQSYKDYSVLLIESVQDQSAGNYTCILKTSMGMDKFTANLDVRAPARWIKEPEDKHVTVGSSVALECEATGLPLPTVSWRKIDGGLFQEDSKIGKNDLSIENIKAIDEGKYVCEAKNGIGDQLSKIITIIVRENVFFVIFEVTGISLFIKVA
ncbi:Down syndrome cell adhesion molecule-like protein Dscam2 [Centruroides sculpturatus]|uniref:Down syndrome cell adhesion molecule-like protein Dscam2 n=1 Tax=Centruroides sculpturatus TaxID=218467 RepID=UPI000C6EE2FD|nr:Down syndrome cell adhesion molecule-like protein Dscam2 [Centruroides sculpturatus]